MNAGDLVVSADFGTSGVKVGIVDHTLTLLAKTTETYPLHLGAGGHAEQSPDDWWAALARALTTLRSEIPDLNQRVGSLVFCSQVCGVICADENGRSLRPCLTWLDKRAAQLTRDLIGGFPSVHGYQVAKLIRWLRLANGAPAKNGMDPTAKILWVKQNEPDIFARTSYLLDVKDWLVHRATGRFTTSAESANLTWIMDTRPGREGWSKVLANKCGIPLEKMPEIVNADDVVGHLTTQAAAELGLSADVRVLGGTTDVTAAALGAGEVEDGALHISAATSCWISGFFPSRRLNIASSFATVTSSLNFRPLLILSQENAGSALEWVVRMTGGMARNIADDPNASDSLAAAFVEMGDHQADDPYFFPWLAGERAPLDNDALRGVFHNLSLHHDPNALRRSAIEGVGLNLRWGYGEAIKQKGVKCDGPISMVGGVAANPRFAQFVADALNRDVRVGEARHAGVLGTATLAAQVQGWADSPWEAAKRLKEHTTAYYSPNTTRVQEINARNQHIQKIRRNIIQSYGHKGVS